MRIADFDTYKFILKERAGIELSPRQAYSLDSHLKPICEKWDYNSLSALTLALRGMPPSELIQDIVEALTEKETSFFHDPKLFFVFETLLLPYFLRARHKTEHLRLWSAGCAYGQEPYSLSIILKENLASKDWTYTIRATDISRQAIEISEEAKYSQFEVQNGLSAKYLVKYFDLHNNHWQLKDTIKNDVMFEHQNLLECSTSNEEYDVITCCNTLCSVNDEVRKKILQKLAKNLAPDGVIMLSSTEAIPDLPTGLKPMKEYNYILVQSENNIDYRNIKDKKPIRSFFKKS